MHRQVQPIFGFVVMMSHRSSHAGPPDRAELNLRPTDPSAKIGPLVRFNFLSAKLFKLIKPGVDLESISLFYSSKAATNNDAGSIKVVGKCKR